MSDQLMKLKPHARTLLAPPEFAAGATMDDTAFEPFDRDISLEPLDEIMAEVLRRFASAKPETSDAWLAPRVHATLRLYRREAAEKAVWHYLSVRFRKYVLWRWETGTGVDPVRILGSTNRNALARLWSAAELLRNGPDYAAVSDGFRLQEIMQWVLDIDAFQNRAAALAYVKTLSTWADGQTARALAKGLNHLLSSVSLDSLAPDMGDSGDAFQLWISQEPDETLMYEKLPQGPDDLRVPESQIDAVSAVLNKLLKDMDLAVPQPLKSGSSKPPVAQPVK